MLKDMKKNIAVGFLAISIIVIAVVVGMTYKNYIEEQKLLEDSIKSQLISIASAAKEYLIPEDFTNYKSDEDKDERFDKTLAQLRALALSVNAEYIYTLRQEGDKYFFVYDTDMADDSIQEYELEAVHKEAFLGHVSAGIMNVSDEWGNFNTAAIPYFKNGAVLGVICVDIEDKYVSQSIVQAKLNIILLVVAILLLMLIVGFVLARLLKEIEKSQNELDRMAHYDLLTNLPNRQYLLEYLRDVTVKGKNTEFAIYFVDLDNFKRVNDTAGHDAGDALLRNISDYLKGAYEHSKLFRPTSGKLNVAARIGGDEFILISPGINNIEDASAFAKELLDGFNKSRIDKHISKYDVGLSIGVALFPYSSEDYNVLIKYADIAMYHAKKSGKNCFMIYNEEMTPKDEK